MFDSNFIRQIRKQEEEWREKYLKRIPEKRNSSGIPIKPLYTPKDIEHLSHEKDLGFPGKYPFTRGIHNTMYRERLWTMRQFSGFGTAEQTNQRYKYLLSEGETGLSVAFDFPTIEGYDSDDPLSLGEVGVCGVAIDTLKDMEILFDGIPLDKVTTSMTINAPAPILLSMYLAVAEEQGVSWDNVGGTVQNDALKEFIAQKSFIFPPEPSVKLVIDVIEFCTKSVPRWNPVSISGYHIREAGATAVQELAFTLSDGLTYVEKTIERGLDIDGFAPRLSLFFCSHNDFFEEVAKFRAARRMWARFMKERFGAKNDRSLWMRFHTQTSGVALTAQQPENNIARVTIQALAAALGGTQSLHTNSFDEAWQLPSEKAVTIALRTQQIIAHESGVTETIDPLAGSYYMEWLTDKMEAEAMKYIDRIDSMGGMIEAIKRGYPQREIADSAYEFQKDVEKKKQVIVGVNQFADEGEEIKIPRFKIDPEVERIQIKRLRQVKESRNKEKVSRHLNELKKAAEKNENVMPYVLNCVRAFTSLGEIINTLKEVYGEYKELLIF
ncbi:MAG: methylmalonyl-CoA mutase [Candidatus Hodarchaeota archaeon]